MSLVFKRYPQALEPSSSHTLLNPSNVPAGPEAAPTFASQSAASPTFTPQSTSSNLGLSSGSVVYLAAFLSFFGLLLLVLVIWKVRGWRRKSDASDERPVEKIKLGDVEAQTPTRPIIPVTPQAGVRWQPQIRSISGPAPKESERRTNSLPPKRARSPPPTSRTKHQDPFSDQCPKSAPAYAVSFSDDALRPPPKGSSLRSEMMSPPVTPHALAASGMQTRTLGRPIPGSKNVDA